MSSRSFPLRRVALPLLTAAAVAAALVLAFTARRGPGARSDRLSIPSRQGTYAFETRLPDGPWRGLRLIRLVEPSPLVADLCGSGPTGLPLFAVSGYVEPDGIRVHATDVVTASGDTVSHLADTRLVCSLPADHPGQELLTWLPEAWCEEVGNPSRHDTVALFLHNYGSEFRFSEPGLVSRALRRAARGESLVVRSTLAVTGLRGAVRERIALDPRYAPAAGVPYRCEGDTLVIAESDISYQNSDLFSVLFVQPVLSDGDNVTVTDTEDLEGSRRGLFFVAPGRGAVLWYRQLGVLCLRRHIVDLEGDGIEEILLETYGSENDVSGSGTTDAGTAYILCLDLGGNILWRHRVHGVYVGAQAAAVDVLDAPGSEVVMVWSSGRHDGVGGAAVLSAAGEVLSERRDLGGLYGLTVADFDADGEAELVTGGPDRRVYRLGPGLGTEATWASTVDLLAPASGAKEGRFADCGVIWRSRSIPLASTDVSGDGRPDIVALETAWSRWDDLPGGGTLRCGRGDLVVLSADLEEYARAACDGTTTGDGRYPNDMPACMRIEVVPLDADGDGGDELCVLMRTGGVFLYGRVGGPAGS
jgi:hypothetical protein